MRKAMTIVLGVAMFIGAAGVAGAQTGMAGMGDALKKGAADSAKQGVDNALGVQGAPAAAANPQAAAPAADAAGGAAGAAPAAAPAGGAAGAAPAAAPAGDGGTQGE